MGFFLLLPLADFPHERKPVKARLQVSRWQLRAGIGTKTRPGLLSVNAQVVRVKFFVLFSSPTRGLVVSGMSSTENSAKIKLLESQLAQLSKAPHTPAQDEEIQRLQARVRELQAEILGGNDKKQEMTPIERVRLARHPDRPYTLDFVHLLFTDFHELHGDRRFADDPAIVCGFARFEGEPVFIVGQQKANYKQRKMEDRQYRNFGMPKPEGYRKAIRLMQMAAKFRRPIISFIDTPGAYPGIEAEERGQGEAIARNIIEMMRLPTPTIGVIIGEGGSGGALAIGACDRVNMLENTIYSVISPEGCASILWRDANKADLAAAALKITPEPLKAAGIIDEIIPEPGEGAHTDYAATAENLRPYLVKQLKELSALPPEKLIEPAVCTLLSDGRLCD
jgi:acetyl-coenzyme A carboxylase carboxyl transferase subunit alpha 